MPDFIPRSDVTFVQWARAFCDGIAERYAELGITLEQSEAATVEYEAFAEAFHRASNPSTRTPGAIAAKRVTADALRKTVRMLAHLARVAPGMTPEGLIALGVRPQKPDRTPIGPPRSAPSIQLIRQSGAQLTLHLLDTATPLSRGMPKHVDQAAIFVFVGETAPASLETWTIVRQTSRARVTITLPAGTRPGSTVHVTARWTSPRGQPGPLASPITAYAGAALKAPTALRAA